MPSSLTPAFPGLAYPGVTYPGDGSGLNPALVLLIPSQSTPFTGSRTTRFTYDLLNQAGELVGPLLGVKPGGTLEWSSAKSVKGSGKITVSDMGQDVDWLSSRIKITETVIDAAGVWVIPRKVWVPNVPTDQRTGTGRTVDVELLDTVSLLDQRKIKQSFTVNAGDSIEAKLLELIGDYGPWLNPRKPGLMMTHTDKTAATTKTYSPGTTWLQIANELLNSINYWPITADDEGGWHADPYVAPDARSLAWEFVSGKTCIFRPEWSRSQDWGEVPTEVVLTTQGDQDTPGMTGYFKAPDNYPGSEAQRGGIVITYSDTAEAADQATLDALAERRYHDVASPQATVQIKHLDIPLAVNDAVRFASRRAGIDARHVVSSTKVTLSATALQETTLTEVAGG